MKIYYLTSNIVLIVFLFLTSCNSTTTNHEVSENDNTIQFTRQQFESTNMQIDNPQVRTINKTIQTNGHIKPSPEGAAMINAVIPGIVTGLKHTEGEHIKKGNTLFNVSGREVVDIQNKYVKACSDFNYAQRELDRISKLVEEKITARKELTSAENNFKIAKAEKESLEAILNLMHLNPNQVENGNIKANYNVPSPISGYITKINIDNGQYIAPQYNAINIVDNSKLQLILNVFEKDINNLSKGQTVLFYDPDRKTDKQKATITSIGRSINPETKTIPCIAQIENTEENIFINGMYAECDVITETKETITLPRNAIINENDSDYVLVKTKEENDVLIFSKVKVETGLTSSTHIEIKTKGLERVLVKGTYYYQY